MWIGGKCVRGGLFRRSRVPAKSSACVPSPRDLLCVGTFIKIFAVANPHEGDCNSEPHLYIGRNPEEKRGVRGWVA